MKYASGSYWKNKSFDLSKFSDVIGLFSVKALRGVTLSPVYLYRPNINFKCTTPSLAGTGKYTGRDFTFALLKERALSR